MGNTTNASHPLPQIWERISARYLRNRLTQEIIEENPVMLPSHEEQLAATTALKKRISLHHPSIAKIIYYRTTEDSSLCRQLQSNYEILIYTEYTGDTLEGVLEQKGERLYHSPCQCTHIISAAEYLKDHYGFFCITPSMVFLGNRKEKNTKVWINSKVELSQREIIASEEDMCDSLCNLLRNLKSTRFCKALTDDQIENAFKIKKIAQLKSYIFDAHRIREESNRHKKSNSAAIYSNDKNQEFKINSYQRIDKNEKSQINKKIYNIKATSMPQKTQESKMQKGPEFLQLKPRDINDQNRLFSKSSHTKNASPDIYHHRPIQPHPLKVNFIYPQYERQHTGIKQVQNIFEPQKNAILQINKPTYIEIYKHQDQQNNIIQEIHHKKTLFETNMQALAVSLYESNPKSFTSSPKNLEKPLNTEHFTAKEMELPLPDAEEKTTPARLPTTSRSPKGHKQGQVKPIEEVPQIIYNRYQRQISTQAGKNWKNKEKPQRIVSGCNKFQKYKDAIKSYEQKLRQKLANSVGNANPVIIKQKNLLGVRKTTSSPKPTTQCKEAKSVYNDSDQEPISQSINPKPEIVAPKVPFDKFDSEQSIPERDYPSSHEIDSKKLEQIINTKELTSKKMRQRLQKMDLERQLEKQKIMIQNQMQDLLKQNTMREQYRSIRQKIKQKKQTFAQLKAEATKILQDLDY